MSAATMRDLRMQGAGNFRDIGDRPGANGCRIRAATVFRSGELSRLTDADHDALRRLGVAFVADLRSAKECELLPTRWPDDLDTTFHRADISMDSRVDGRPPMDLILENPTAEHASSVVARAFGSIADLCGPALCTITERLAGSGGPVIFHCTNGRDRTGIIAAMILYMLGASREHIVHDFMLTNERINFKLTVDNSVATFRKAMGIELDRHIVELVTMVQPLYLDALFESFALQYGAPEGYLEHFGIDTALRRALQERLLEPG